MQNESSRKILGAFVVGIALVAGAYTLGSIANPKQVPQQAAVGTAVENAAPRVAIEVTDEDNNGIEDWRDSFVTSEPVIIQQEDAEYDAPETLTGRMGVNFIEDIIRSKMYDGVGRTEEEVIVDTVNLMEQETSYQLYDIPDITIINEYTDADIKNYANAFAGAIMNNELANSENELTILYRVVSYGETDRIPELQAISNAYASMRDEALTIPVPVEFVKLHLDLVNTFHAVSKDIEAMTLTITDPAFALLRIRRYEDDALGLNYALQNMYAGLTSYSRLFGAGDAALYFNNFSPEGTI